MENQSDIASACQDWWLVDAELDALTAQYSSVETGLIKTFGSLEAAQSDENTAALLKSFDHRFEAHWGSIRRNRTEGISPNFVLAFGGVQSVYRVPLSEANLPTLKANFENELDNARLNNKAGAIAIIGVVLGVITVAIEGMRFYRETLDRQREEREREEAKRQLQEKCGEGARTGISSSGGSATDRDLDRISRTC